MQSILEEFARGNILPEPRFFKKNSHYEQVMQQLIETEEKLFSALNEQEKELLKPFQKPNQKLAFFQELTGSFMAIGWAYL